MVIRDRVPSRVHGIPHTILQDTITLAKASNDYAIEREAHRAGRRKGTDMENTTVKGDFGAQGQVSSEIRREARAN